MMSLSVLGWSPCYSANSAQDAPPPNALSRTETYGYDQYLDYLTSANYNDGLSNASPTWSYDAAGNRTDSSPPLTPIIRSTSATPLGSVFAGRRS